MCVWCWARSEVRSRGRASGGRSPCDRACPHATARAALWPRASSRPRHSRRGTATMRSLRGQDGHAEVASRRLLRLPRALLMCVAARPDGGKVVVGQIRGHPGFSHLFFVFLMQMIAHLISSLSRARTQATGSAFGGSLSNYDDDEHIVRFEARDSLIFSAGQGSARTRHFWWLSRSR